MATCASRLCRYNAVDHARTECTCSCQDEANLQMYGTITIEEHVFMTQILPLHQQLEQSVAQARAQRERREGSRCVAW